MALLEENKILDRASEDLPTSEEIGERRRAGRGMERPELAILVAFAKRLLARALEASDFVEEPWLERDLREYFPAEVVKRFGHLLADHPLKRQLICMVNSNQVVNSLGPTFVSQLMAERGAEPADIVRAFRIARAVTGADARWEVVERLEGVDKAPQLELMGGVDSLVEETTRWYLTWEPDADIEETIAAGRDGFERLVGRARRARLRRAPAPARRRTRSGWSALGVPEPLARAHALRPEQRYAPDMVWVAGATGRAIEEVAEVFFAVGAELRLDWIETELERVPAPSRMQRWALQAVREDAAQVRRELAGGVLAESARRRRRRRSRRYLAERGDALRRFTAFLRSLSREGEPDLAGPHARRPPAARAAPKPTNLGRAVPGLPRYGPSPCSLLALLLLLAAPGGRRARNRRRATRRARPAPPTPPASTAARSQLDGHQRRYEVYVPANARRNAPVVFMFHGGSGDGERFLKISGWREQADATGLIAVFPTGERYRITETGRLRDALGELRDPRGDRGGRDAARRRRRLRRRDARRHRGRAARRRAPHLRLRLLQRRRAWPPGWRSTAPRRSPRSRSPAADCRPRSRPAAARADLLDARLARRPRAGQAGPAAGRAAAEPAPDPRQPGARRLPRRRARDARARPRARPPWSSAAARRASAGPRGARCCASR